MKRYQSPKKYLRKTWIHRSLVDKRYCCTHGGTRTPNLRFRRPTPYPLGHAGTPAQNSCNTPRQLTSPPTEAKWYICAPPGNRTRVARMGILHDTTTPAALCLNPLFWTKTRHSWSLVWFSPALPHVAGSDIGVVPLRIYVLNKHSPASSVGRAWDS